MSGNPAMRPSGHQDLPVAGPSGRRRPLTRPRPSSTGVAVLVIVAVGNVLLWTLARPPGDPTSRFIGELCGAEAVLLFSCALVLATVIPPIERAFGGLDQVAVWHRRVAMAGVVLLVPHVALVTSPPDPYLTTTGQYLGDVAVLGLLFLSLWALAPRMRAARWPGPVRRIAALSYERWLTAHRLTGLFVAAAVVHGAMVDVVLHRSTVLRAVYLTVGSVGIIAYLYRELLARFVIPTHDYTVATVKRLNDTTVDVALDPVREPIVFTAGQFTFLAFGGPGGWQRHPFTVASAPSARQLEVSIKAVGDYTSQLNEQLRPGVPAKVAGPFGGFDYRVGGRDQIWIAGGIGVTPFLSWLRALDGPLDLEVDLYYSVAHAQDALFLDEITAIAEGQPSLRLHVVHTDTDGLMTADTVMAGRQGATPWIYMCGPPPMMHALAKGFRASGVPSAQIRWEQFDVR
jgi:predicted ferric reductase